MEGEPISCAAHLFTFEEDTALPLDQFFSLYKDRFPMLAVIVDGHYGNTIYDCFENFQVFRIHGYTTQERVVCTDSKSAHATVDTYYSLPLRSVHGFQKIKGHTSLGAKQSLEAIVSESSLPVMVKLASEGDTRLGWKTTRDLGNLLIMAKYQDHYMMINNIDTTDIVMNSTSCLMAMSTELTATPITGFKYKSRDEYDAYWRKLNHQVATSGEVYDKTRGSPAFVMYEHVKELPETLHKLIFGKDNDDGEGDYELMEDVVKPPVVPPKKSATLPASSSTNPTSPTSQTATKDTKDKPKQPKTGAVSKLLSKFHKQKPVDTSLDDKDNTPTEPAPEPTPTGTTRTYKNTQAQSNEAPPVHRKPKPADAKPAAVGAPPPVPNKPKNKPAERNISQSNAENTDITDKPYENRAIPNAVVRPSMRSPAIAADRKPQPLPQRPTQPEEPIEDTYGSEYSEPFEYEELRKPSPKPPPDTPEAEEIYYYGDLSETDNITIPATKEDTNNRNKDTKVATTKSGSTAEISRANQSLVPGGVHAVAPAKKQEQSPRGEPEEFTITGFSISDVSGALKTLRLDKHIETFAENQVDGEILSALSVADMVDELGMKKLEAIRLQKYVQSGHVPN